MSAPLKDKDCIIAIFDSFAKTVMKNECRNAVDEEKRKREREQAVTEKLQYLFETQVQDDVYPSEHLVLQGKSLSLIHISALSWDWLFRSKIRPGIISSC